MKLELVLTSTLINHRLKPISSYFSDFKSHLEANLAVILLDFFMPKIPSNFISQSYGLEKC